MLRPWTHGTGVFIIAEERAMEPEIKPRPIAAKLALLGLCLYGVAYIAMVIAIAVHG